MHTDSYVLAFEEPEISIHPWLLELLINLLKSSNKQIILTTHSPALLNHVSVDDIIIIEKQNGQSIFRRIRKKEELNAVKRLLEEGVPLGEQWMSNVFGGVP